MALVLCGVLSFWREKMCMISQMVNEKACFKGSLLEGAVAAGD